VCTNGGQDGGHAIIQSINPALFTAVLTQRTHTARIARDIEAAKKANITGTPLPWSFLAALPAQPFVPALPDRAQQVLGRVRLDARYFAPLLLQVISILNVQT
jgi:hypothetical protein